MAIFIHCSRIVSAGIISEQLCRANHLQVLYTQRHPYGYPNIYKHPHNYLNTYDHAYTDDYSNPS
jgi:hypothetical protein